MHSLNICDGRRWEGMVKGNNFQNTGTQLLALKYYRTKISARRTAADSKMGRNMKRAVLQTRTFLLFST